MIVVLSSKRSVATRFGCFRQPLGQIRDLLAVPRVDLDQLFVRVLRCYPVRAKAGDGLRRYPAIASSLDPTLRVIWKLAIRAKSAAKLLTISSICMRLICGMLSLSSSIFGGSFGTAWPALFLFLFVSQFRFQFLFDGANHLQDARPKSADLRC